MTTKKRNKRQRLLRHSLAVWLLIAPGAYAQTDTVYCTEADREVFNKYLGFMEEKARLPFDSLILETASFFLGTPYVGATLEQEPEGLVVNLRELDCFTFVENVIALSRTVAAGDSTFEQYCEQLRLIRYREGKIGGYADRLHYTSDWLYENDRKQILHYIGGESSREPHTFDLHFMSSHPASYRQLKADSSLIPRIKEIEQTVNARTPYYYIVPKHAVDTFALQLCSGDMVGFVTSIAGLDISHVGLITRAGDTLTFIHASSLAKEVIINKESLRAYVESGKTCTGIVTARPLPPTPLKDCEEEAQNNSKANLKPTP
ncbi:MAG: DUF1460 domain-containing protein [Tannerellaceae bacterium]|jgi:hypothetical protein|nr:DUF1460 domain-containing protein [Tannerellaceae bacterium]